jgi:DNA-binding NarL/FixJ family response regulator
MAPTAAGARTTRVVLGHPGALVRLGFAELISRVADAQLCASAETIEQTIAAVNRHRPDVLVLAADFREVVAKMRHAPRVLLLSPHHHAGKGGACARTCAFSSEQDSTEALVDTLERVIACSEAGVGTAACARCPLKLSFAPAELPLSRREREVFEQIASGRPTSRIAAQLGISVKTVETYRGNIKNKLGLPSSTALTEAALLWRRGMRLP